MNGHAAASPWHRGEVAIQESVGMAGRMAELGPRVHAPSRGGALGLDGALEAKLNRCGAQIERVRG